MKLISLFCLFVLMLFSGNIFAQQTKLVVEKDENKRSKAKEEFYVLATNGKIKHGSYKKYGYSGKLELDGFYKNGKKDSVWSEYSYLGKLLNRGAYTHDVRTGVWEYYNNDNKLEQKYNHSTNQLVYFENPNLGKPVEISVIKNGDTVSVEAERPVLFVGGTWQHSYLLNNEINYPHHAVDNNIQGTVYITFIVDIHGKARNHVAVTKLGYGLEEESLRVMKILTNEWIPAIKDGKPIESVVKMPVKYVIQ